MIELRRVLTVHLKTIHPRVFYQVAPDDAAYPYLVLDFPNNSDDGEALQMVTVDVDGWDNNTDTTSLETLMKAVNNGLNKKTLSNDKLAVTFYVETKLSLTDTDPRIRRRKYTYQARLFERA